MVNQRADNARPGNSGVRSSLPRRDQENVRLQVQMQERPGMDNDAIGALVIYPRMQLHYALVFQLLS
jgi:hypothetical protein